MDVLYRVVGPDFVAGIVVAEGEVKQTAPVLNYRLAEAELRALLNVNGWGETKAIKYFLSRGFKVTKLNATDPT